MSSTSTSTALEAGGHTSHATDNAPVHISPFRDNLFSRRGQEPFTTLAFKACDEPPTKCEVPEGIVHGWFISGDQRLTSGYFGVKEALADLTYWIESGQLRLSDADLAAVRQQVETLGMPAEDPYRDERREIVSSMNLMNFILGGGEIG